MWKLLLVALLAATQAPSVNVYPVSGFAPLAVRIRTTIPKDPANREACLFYLSDIGDESESCWPLDGDRAAVSTTRYATLPEGHYEVGVIVRRATPPGLIESTREKVTVVGHN